MPLYSHMYNNDNEKYLPDPPHVPIQCIHMVMRAASRVHGNMVKSDGVLIMLRCIEDGPTPTTVSADSHTVTHPQ